MPNPNPSSARRAKKSKRVRAAGDLSELRAVLWSGIETAAGSLDSQDDAVRLRAVHAITQATGAYTKLVEASEFETRLAAVERKLGTSP